MSHIVLISGVSMVVAAITIYLTEVFGVVMPTLAGIGLIGIGGILSILTEDE